MTMVCPCLYYRDAKTALAWLEKSVGFTAIESIPGPDDTIAHAELQLGTSVVMMGTAKPELGKYSPLDLKGATLGMYIVVDDFDAAYTRATSAGAEIVKEPFTTDYGSRDFELRDPEGNHWVFGTYALKLKG